LQLAEEWAEKKNPLHGVERSHLLRDPGLLMAWNPLHGVESQDSKPSAGALRGYSKNPLHGVESLCRAVVYLYLV
jgi:uncharacterized protein (DUF2132 family)